jgi:hypothetical protein
MSNPLPAQIGTVARVWQPTSNGHQLKAASFSPTAIGIKLWPTARPAERKLDDVLSRGNLREIESAANNESY